MSGAIVKRKVARLFENKQPKHMMRIRTSEHHVLHCTNGHPFWTRRGWVTASNLQLTDEVLSYEMHTMRSTNTGDNRIAPVHFEKNRSNILHNKVRNDVPGYAPEALQKTSASDCEMLHVRKSCGLDRASAFSIEKNRSCILQPDLLGRVSGTRSRRRRQQKRTRNMHLLG